MLPVGDSKTVGAPFNLGTDGYQDYLVASLPDLEIPAALAAGSKTTAATLADFPAFAAAWTADDPDFVLVNLGTNDLPLIRDLSLTEGTWAMGDLLDAIHAEWPGAQVYLMRIIRTDHTTEQDLLNDTWIPNVLASRSSWAFVGPDERIFLPGYLTDTTHPNDAGYQRTAAQWREVIVGSYE